MHESEVQIGNPGFINRWSDAKNKKLSIGFALMRFALIFALLAAAVNVQLVDAQSAQPDEPAANPARPTVSNPATLTPVGYLQFETGTLGATNSPEFSTRYEFNEVIKLAVSRRLEFIESSEPA